MDNYIIFNIFLALFFIVLVSLYLLISYKNKKTKNRNQKKIVDRLKKIVALSEKEENKKSNEVISIKSIPISTMITYTNDKVVHPSITLSQQQL
tara:strand:+ start:1115 stop:1396 length:282 start_codon:yes stop_codon:yes gene_type:complete